MKRSFVILVLSAFLGNRAFAEWTRDTRRIESEQVALWEQKLKDARLAAPAMRPEMLWLGLRNMGHRKSMAGCNPDVRSIYQEIQKELLSIPGHARYFAEEIKREQKEVAEYPTSTGPRISYDRNRSKYFATLSHLPSPETIAVLGEFLSDDIDTPRYRISPDSDWGENPKANSYGSAVTLTRIGLREPPGTRESYDADPVLHLAKTRAWWEEVKSGRRSFSFKGQAVEYRFKPDGTWDTLPIANPPDDRPQSVVGTTLERPIKRPESNRGESPDSPVGQTGWWAILGGFALVVLGAWFWRKKSA